MTDGSARSLAAPLAAIAAGGLLSVLLGIYGSVHEPTFDEIATFGFGSMISMKVYLSLAAGILAVGQVVGALWLYGKLPLAAPSWLGMGHRAGGVLTVLLTLPVAYHCLWSLGLQVGEPATARVAAHSLLGCAVYGALVVKVFAVRSRTAPGWFLPVAGGLLFTLLIGVVVTSAGWYLQSVGLPSGSGY